jgi:hypothetical protein
MIRISKIAIALGGIAVGLSCFAKGFTPDMIKRNGLTDEQIDDIFSHRTNAVLTVTREMWMNMKYRLHRFDNMREWLNLGIEGKLGDEILRVTDTNLYFKSRVSTLLNEKFQLQSETNYLNYAVKKWESESAKAWSEYQAQTNLNASLQSSIDNSLTNLVERKTALQEKIDDNTYILLRPFLKVELAAIEKIIDRLEGKKENE